MISGWKLCSSIVRGLFDVANEKDAEPVYTMVDGLPVIELKEAV